MGPSATRFAACTRHQAMVICLATGMMLAYCLFLGLTRDTSPPKEPVPEEKADDLLYKNDPLFHRRMVGHIRAGQSYYDAANIELRSNGYRPDSMFNWRLPTYTWVLSVFPNDLCIQLFLALISFAALAMIHAAERREAGPAAAAITVVLLLGVFGWCIASDAVYFHELGAAIFLGLSLGALGMGQRGLGVAAAIFALCWRELVLPYCLVATGLAWWQGRRRELAFLLVGLALFASLLVNHGVQVSSRLTAGDRSPASVSEWVHFGGVLFNLIALRTNMVLIAAPGWLLACYFCLAMLGLLGWRGERGILVTGTALAYLVAFSIIGKPYNVYWGYLMAPFLPFGVARAPAALSDLWRALTPKPGPGAGSARAIN